MFSSSFAYAFTGVKSGCIGPVMAAAAMLAGAAVAMEGPSLRIGGRLLIGPAGKVYEFASPESAAAWLAGTKGAAVGELNALAVMPAARKAAWLDGKRQKLAAIAGRVVEAALKMTDEERRAALLAEADYCLKKWS